MNIRNPYTINSGKIPKQYINRDVLISEIISALESDVIDEQAFKLTGIIDGSLRGQIKIVLPRFSEYVKNKIEEE